MPAVNTMDDSLTTTETTTTTTTEGSNTTTEGSNTTTEGTITTTSTMTTVTGGGAGSNKAVLPIAVGVGCAAAVLLIILITVLLYLRKKRKDRERLCRISVLPDPNVIDRVNHGFDDESATVEPITEGPLPSPPNVLTFPATPQESVQPTPEEDRRANTPARKGSEPGFLAERDRQVLPPSPAPHVQGAARYVNMGPERNRENPELHLDKNGGGKAAINTKLALSSSVKAPPPTPHGSHRSYVNTGKDKDVHNPDLTPLKKAKRDYVNVTDWLERPETRRVPSMVPPDDIVGGANTEYLPMYGNV